MSRSRALAALAASLPREVPTKDGRRRGAEEEARLDGAFRALAASPFGADVLEYLRSITIETVLLPSATDAELRHMEGMRALYAIIAARTEKRD